MEAAPELQAFVDHFEFKIDDPQMDGMSDGPYSMHGFLKGWNAGNLFGYQALAASNSNSGEILTKPATEIEAVWRWNKDRHAVNARLGPEILVPRILWLKVEDQLFSAIIWPDGIRTLIPKVDQIIIARDELVPRRFFFRTQKDRCLVAQNELEGVLPGFEQADFALPVIHLQYAEPSDSIKKFIQNLATATQKMNSVPADQVLNAELIANVSKRK